MKIGAIKTANANGLHGCLASQTKLIAIGDHFADYFNNKLTIYGHYSGPNTVVIFNSWRDCLKAILHSKSISDISRFGLIEK